MNQENEKPIEDRVLNEIKTGKVKMKSKSYYFWKGFLITLIIIAVVLITFYLVSFIAFALRLSGSWYLLGFGPSGLRPFLSLAPWPLITLVAVLMGLIVLSLKSFSSAYKQPLLYSWLAIVLLVFTGSLLFYRSQMHSNLYVMSTRNNLPIAGRLYQCCGMQKPRHVNVNRGNIEEINELGCLMVRPDGQTLTIIVGENTRIISEEPLQEEDEIIVIGNQTDDTVLALAIEKISDEFNRFFRQMRKDLSPNGFQLNNLPPR